MNNKRKIILLTSTLAATSVIALTSVFALGNVSPLSAEKGSRQITATGANTIHVTYQTSTPGYPSMAMRPCSVSLSAANGILSTVFFSLEILHRHVGEP